MNAVEGGSVRTAEVCDVSPIEEIIEEARQGRMFILVDHEDRENEGDLVIPAPFATPQAVNFMARYGRGLICLCLTGERADALDLKPMQAVNGTAQGTAFTQSIEACEGITTGISAFDRARTIRVGWDPAFGKQDIVSPGHVFPLRARDGGVLVRAGHTEASVDIARLAGQPPAAVICEIMHDDGTMARLPDLLIFAARHGLKVGSISDLVAYRLRQDSLLRDVARRDIRSRWGGDWSMRVFEDGTTGARHIALIKGELATADPVPVHIHVLDPLADVLGISEAGTDRSIAPAMRRIAEEGRGVVVLLCEVDSALPVTDRAGRRTLRDYGLGAQILAALHLSRLHVLTYSDLPTLIGLDAYGLEVCSSEVLGEAE